MVWVIDTWVLRTAGDMDAKKCLEAADFLLTILRSEHAIALDLEQGIEEEYWTDLDRRGLVAKWWFAVKGKAGKLCWYSQHLPNRFHEGLQRLQFHADDFKFVGTAYNSPDNLLVSEDSDYDPPVLPYLWEQVGVGVLALDDALDVV